MEILYSAEKAWVNGEMTDTYLHLGTFKNTGKPVDVFFIVKQRPVITSYDWDGYTLDRKLTAPVVYWSFAHKNYGGCLPSGNGYQEKAGPPGGDIRTTEQMLASIIGIAKKKYTTQVEWTV